MKTFAEMTPDEVTRVGVLAQSVENLDKALDWAAAMRDTRDACINQLRVLGWTMTDVSELSGLSQPMIQKIGERGGIKSVRRATRR